jgi:hypothetical protein
MTIFRRHLWSRLGAALGVLAVLVLALLAPIHHLHAIERALAKAVDGHAGQPAVSHSEHAAHDHGAPPAKPQRVPTDCPVCTLGKVAAALLPPSVPAVATVVFLHDSPAAIPTTAPLSGWSHSSARPRAPPVHA